uniref:Uncharacterized protein n=1 Tax=Ditylum brightwellii TaxID=49249 RepID=A0A6V2LBQ7_9STRA|mmetsp:Transcript_14776/g.20956  ORF Transcript_14776/g.20956 Transcript_14776/m.20956 type:complete len:412 (+) Transcript_14776:111-1346(+)
MFNNSIFKLLDLNPRSEVERKWLNTDAILKETKKTPLNAELMYTFSTQCFPCYTWHSDIFIPFRRFPLHQAILLRAPITVIDALSCTVALREKFEEGTALHLALKCSPEPSWDVVSLLLERYPQAVTEEDHHQFTALHLLFQRGAPLEVVNLLVSKCPDYALMHKNRFGATPLHLACHYKALFEVIFLLTSHLPGALKEVDKYGCMPLHLACRYRGSSEVIALLASTWPDAIKKKDKCGDTPLHLACANKAPYEVVSLLFNSWPRALEKEDKRGRTPFDWACLKDAPLDVIYFMADKWFRNKKRRHCLYLRVLACHELDEDIDVLCVHASVALNGIEKSYTVVNDALLYFIQLKMWNFVLLIISSYPNMTKTMEFQTNQMADYFSMVGKVCNLTGLWNVLLNEQEILEGVY